MVAFSLSGDIVEQHGESGLARLCGVTHQAINKLLHKSVTTNLSKKSSDSLSDKGLPVTTSESQSVATNSIEKPSNSSPDEGLPLATNENDRPKESQLAPQIPPPDAIELDIATIDLLATMTLPRKATPLCVFPGTCSSRPWNRNSSKVVAV